MNIVIVRMGLIGNFLLLLVVFNHLKIEFFCSSSFSFMAEKILSFRRLKLLDLAVMIKKKPHYVIKRTAAGLGFFTLVSIPEDKKIIEYIGPVLTTEEANKKGGKYLMAIDEEHLIDGSPRSNAARYINHSCEPNAKAYRTGVRVWIWSTRPIKAGEEITYNYGRKYVEDFIKSTGCKCVKCLRKT